MDLLALAVLGLSALAIAAGARRPKLKPLPVRKNDKKRS